MFSDPAPRAGGGDRGFVPVPQTDGPENDFNSEHGHVSDQRRRSWVPRDLRSQFQQVLGRGAIKWERDQETAHNSPAFPDMTVVGGSYTSIPTKHCEEADSGGYIEYRPSYYGPEAAGLSPISSAKAGLGLEVRSGPVTLDLPSGGHYADDPWSDNSYHGSQGNTEEDNHRLGRKNYKPAFLKGNILIVLLLILVALVALAEVAIQLLPNGFGVSPPHTHESITAASLRSLSGDTHNLPNNLGYFKRRNETAPLTTPSTTPPSSSLSQTATVPSASEPQPSITLPSPFPTDTLSSPTSPPTTSSSSMSKTQESTESRESSSTRDPISGHPGSSEHSGQPPIPITPSSSEHSSQTPIPITPSGPNPPLSPGPNPTITDTIPTASNPTVTETMTLPPLPPSVSVTNSDSLSTPSMSLSLPNPTGSSGATVAPSETTTGHFTSTSKANPSSATITQIPPGESNSADSHTMTESHSTSYYPPSVTAGNGLSLTGPSPDLPTIAPTLPKPFVTITKSPDGQPPPPPITKTITTFTSQGDTVFPTTILNVIKADVDNVITEYVTTHTDLHGKPTWTETILAGGALETTIFTDDRGNPTSTAILVKLHQPRRTTLVDNQGRATSTQEYYLVSSTRTLYDADGRPTATETSIVTEVPTRITLFNAKGFATETRTELVPISSSTTTAIATPTLEVSVKKVNVTPISDGQHFLGLMLPTFIAIAVSVPIRLLDQTVRLYQPFHALVSPRGALARDSICFQTADMLCLRARFHSLLNGQVLLTLTGLLLLGSLVIVPLSSEIIRIVLEGPECTTSNGNTLTCNMVLSVCSVPAQIFVGLLASIAILLGVTIAVLRKWETGLDWNPWSLFRMGYLAGNNEIRTLLLRRLREKNGRVTNTEANQTFNGIPFVLDYWKDNAELKYSILIPNETQALRKDGKSVTFGKIKTPRRRRKGNSVPFFILTWPGRLLFLALLCAVMISLPVYDINGRGQDGTQFMMGRWRVVRFIFICVGALISLIWGSFFYAAAFISPHRLLHRIRLYNGEAIYMTPSTNPFDGIRSSLMPGRRDFYLGLVSAVSILSEILPILLSTALDKSAEGFWAHTVCYWMGLSVLSIMILTVVGSFFVIWPHMPIDPSTIAGGMYYALTNFVSMNPSSGLLLGRVNHSVV